MEVTKLGDWRRNPWVMLRLNEAMRAEVAWAAAEDRRTVAETILDILTDWLIAREAAGKSK
jgi:hypothetical protein